MNRCDLMLSLTLVLLACIGTTFITVLLHQAARLRELQRWIRQLHQELDHNPYNDRETHDQNWKHR